MKKTLRRKFAAIICFVLGLTSVLSGGLMNTVSAKAETTQETETTKVDTLDINFFDYSADSTEISSGLMFTMDASNKTSYQNRWYEFFRAVGIVQSELDTTTNAPVFNYLPSEQNGGQNLFSTANVGCYEGSAALQLEADSDGFYGFDSSTQQMLFNGSTEFSGGTAVSANIVDRNGTANPWLPQFMPLGSDNFLFGMSFEKSFYYAGAGTQISTIDSEGNETLKDMVFTFSGDDDVWVFVDGVLVLDIGGIHGSYSGTINFTTGEVEYSYAGIKLGNGTEDTNSNFTTTSPDSNLIWGGSNPDITLQNLDKGPHTLNFFYLERGANLSNCKFSYNLMAEEQQYSVTYEVEDANSGLVSGYTVPVESDKYAGDTVNVAAMISAGQLNAGFEVTDWEIVTVDADGNKVVEIIEAGEIRSFTMPACNVVLRAVVSQKLYSYTVEYYFNGVQDPSKTRPGSTVGIEKTIVTESFRETETYNGNSYDYDYAVIEGQQYTTNAGLQLTLSADETQNVYRVYYSRTIPYIPPYVPEDDPTPTPEITTTPEPTVTPEPTTTPEPTQEPEEEEIPVPSVPAGTPEEEEEPTPEPTQEPEEEIDIEIPDNPEGGDAEETLPQTGTTPIVLFYAFGVMFMLVGAAMLVADYKRRKNA